VTRAILAEDDTEFRQCVKKILSPRYPSIQLIEAGDGKEAMSKIDLLTPDMIFMDIQLPDKNGLELTRMIRARHPNAIIVILSNHDLRNIGRRRIEMGRIITFQRTHPWVIFFLRSYGSWKIRLTQEIVRGQYSKIYDKAAVFYVTKSLIPGQLL
jgi:CheY-like chemotaxis protein